VTTTLEKAAQFDADGRIAAAWCDIKGFEGLYQISRCAEVRSLDRYIVQGSRHGHPVANIHHGRVLKPYITKSGRRQVILHAGGRRYCRNIDDLVREAFGADHQPLAAT
jgi:hypothetical protein